MADLPSYYSDVSALHACDLSAPLQQLERIYTQKSAMVNLTLLGYLQLWQDWTQQDVQAPLNPNASTAILALLKAQFMDARPDRERPLQQLRATIAHRHLPPDESQQEALATLDHCIALAESIANRQAMSSYHDAIQDAHELRKIATPEEPQAHINWMYVHDSDVTRLRKQNASWRQYLMPQSDSEMSHEKSMER